MKGIKEHGIRMALTVSVMAVLLGIAACGSNESEVSMVPTESNLSDGSTANDFSDKSDESKETKEIMEASLTESNGVTDEVTKDSEEESSEAVEEKSITAEEAQACVTELTAQYGKKLYGNYIPTMFLALNYDYFSAEEKDNYLSIYGLSDEDIDKNYIEFMELQENAMANIYSYTVDDSYPVKYVEDDIAKLEVFIAKEDNKQAAKESDEYVVEFMKTCDTPPSKYWREIEENAKNKDSSSFDIVVWDFNLAMYSWEVPSKSVFQIKKK